VSTPRSLRLPHRVSRTQLSTPRGRFAAFVAEPAGSAARQPAVLVPGYTGSKEDFLSILGSLAAASRSVVAIDMRGQFESAPADNGVGYAPEQLAADVVAVARSVARDSGRVHLLGHSFGGLVARDAALADRDAFLSLTLLGSGPGTIGGQRAADLRELLDYLGPGGADVATLTSLLSTLWEARLGPQAQADGTPEDVISFLRDRMTRNCPLGLIHMARHLLDCPDRTAELAAHASLPKLVSFGENDDAWPPEVQDLMARRLGAECVRIAGAAHSPAVEASQATAGMLTAFWNRAESALA
jgi:pimeloyl-ACP methyl ester carboxylesterase